MKASPWLVRKSDSSLVVPPAAGFIEGIAGLKERYGYWYVAATGRVEAGRRVGVGLFFGLFWAWMWKGVEVDLLYR